MESLYILIPIAIVLVCVAIAIFIWAVKSEQFEDLERQGHNILFEDDKEDEKDKEREVIRHKNFKNLKIENSPKK